MKHLQWLISLFVMFLAAAAAWADEPPAQEPSFTPAPPPAPAETGQEETPWLQLRSFIQAGYLYNLADPASGENDLRVFDHLHNTFTIDLVEVEARHDSPLGGAGFKVKLTAGEAARFIHSRGLGSDEPFDLTEAYLDYRFDVLDGLRLRAGKFSTYFGAELFEAWENPNTSRTYLFNYALPVSHTGIMAELSLSDFSLRLFGLNGWDCTADNNEAKSVGASLTYARADRFMAMLNLLAGPEQDGNTGDWRVLVDLVLTGRPLGWLALTAAGAYGRDRIGGEAVAWHGVQAVVGADPLAYLGVAIRGEFMNDPDGVRTGAAQELKGLTATVEARPADSLKIRLEYRHDWSTKKSFAGNSSQDTLGLAILWAASRG
ncbi:MAG: porin [Myxococcales bacterium]|nr:porin [Myxococcales bacterium]